MFVAVIVAFLPSAILFAIGGATLGLAIRSLRRRSASRAAAVLRLVAGCGTLAFAVLALSVLWSDVQYGMLILPLAAFLLATVWNAVLLTAALIVSKVTQVSRAARQRSASSI